VAAAAWRAHQGGGRALAVQAMAAWSNGLGWAFAGLGQWERVWPTGSARKDMIRFVFSKYFSVLNKFRKFQKNIYKARKILQNFPKF
jgi:hypothetical protein